MVLGDLGVGIALFNAGLIVNEKDWQKVAINILSKSTPHNYGFS